jgi:hypothetical protein
MPGTAGPRGLAFALGGSTSGTLGGGASGGLGASGSPMSVASSEITPPPMFPPSGPPPGMSMGAPASRRPTGSAATGSSRVPGLSDTLSGRTARGSADSAMNLPRRDKQKQHKDRRRRGDAASHDGSSSESSFHLASLPEGVDRLQRIHESKPGTLANLTLLRYREILERFTGGEATLSSQAELPPVARAYLARVHFQRYHPQVIGMRTAREMRTLITIVDYVCQNDGLRALDVALQRQKALELFHQQGTWVQAQQLELIPLDEDRSYFKEELKAAQQEVRSEQKLQRDAYGAQWSAGGRRSQWAYNGGRRQGGAGAASGDGDAAPLNGGDEGDGQGRGRKGGKSKGKGKKGAKGRGRW